MGGRRITKRMVDSLRADGTDYVLWDCDLPGFGVRVRPSGARSYIVHYRAGRGRKASQRKYTLGAVSKLTPDEARKLAKQTIGDVAKDDDPAAARTRKRREMIVREVAGLYLSQHVKPHNKPSWAAEIELILNKRILPEFGARRIGDVTRADIKRWHARMAGSPYRANRCLAVLRKMLSLAHRDWEMRDDNPAIGVKPYPEKRRERFFSPDELKAIGAWLASADRTKADAPFVLVTRLMLLTGMRLGEVAGLRWSDVDLPGNVIRLPDAKAGARPVPLNSHAVAFLANAKHRGEYVCGLAAGAEMMTRFDFHAFWKRLVAGAGLTNARPHDCRHTVATLGAMAGGTAFTLRDLLGHKTVAITSGYVARTVEPIRSLSESIGNRIGAALMSANEQDGEVVEFRPSKEAS